MLNTYKKFKIIYLINEEMDMLNQNGRFGNHGGQYIPETLMNAVIELKTHTKSISGIRNLTESWGSC